jgi:rod shape determining protein RodA
MATLIRSRPAVAERPQRRSDLVLLSSVLALSGFGLLMIYSATRFINERQGAIASFSMERQLVFVVIGLITIGVFSFLDHRELRNFIVPAYVGMVVLLVVVLFFEPINGARSWIQLGVFRLQPAEFAKVITIVALAALFSLQRSPGTLKWKLVFQSALVLGVPAFLIIIEPDLGTSLVFPFIWLVMLFAAGASLKQLGWIVFAGASSVALVFRSGLLAEHQLDRISVFFDPTLDPQGIGFQLLQSKRAIGAGQLVGRGLFQGTQTNLAYIPEQENDFIFTAIAEQLGFIGGVLVLAAFLVIVWRLLAISANSRDRFGALVAVGFAAMIGFHVFVNVGMTVGLAPVTGLPLPFISQGGSFYISMGMVIGIANSIWLRRSVVPGEMYSG